MTFQITDIELKALLDETAKKAAEAASAATQERFLQFLKEKGIQVSDDTASDEENMMAICI